MDSTPSPASGALVTSAASNGTATAGSPATALSPVALPAGTPDPRRGAIALAYDKENGGAPRVVAKGYGLIADNIIARARQEGLYVHEAPEMVGMLMHVALDREIPQALYQAVAELLAWLYSLEAGALKGRAGKKLPVFRPESHG